MVVVIFLLGALAMFLGIPVRDAIEHQTLKTWLLEKSIWATILFGFCFAVMMFVKPEGLNFLSGSLYALIFYLSIIGVFVLPTSVWIISVYAFGYIYWFIGGKRKLSVGPLDEPKYGPTKSEANRPRRNRFGKRSDDAD
ncbi:hypothetical protein [Rhizobium metallidurans]|uniref:ABC-type Na+ efflux pump permease subunit n=1 Tax=Rhizobium metallidurans TaxID=1265931 RepID=A0A7W6GC46_9HYPH|nr:hypothetical protein [Rhizobium metallidurans]MBB3965439.1 ABC-type Na+ efflux pump permease subunit [Rhizobium metallidurans]